MNPLQRMITRLGQFLAPWRRLVPAGPLQVLNRTRGTVLASRLEAAHTGPSRRKGLLGRRSLPAGEGLWIVPCESVHTFFMKFPIDLVYLDRNHQVKKVRDSVGPWRLSACMSARSVLELPSGTIRATQTEQGDTLEIAAAETCGSRAGVCGEPAERDAPMTGSTSLKTALPGGSVAQSHDSKVAPRL